MEKEIYCWTKDGYTLRRASHTDAGIMGESVINEIDWDLRSLG